MNAGRLPPGTRSSYEGRAELSFFINVLNDTFTVLKNSLLTPVLRDQINRAAIVAP
jgi:hypothetical protein